MYNAFMSQSNLYIEIGIGHGEFILELATQGNNYFKINKEDNNKFIGYEVKGRYFKMARSKVKGFENVQLIKSDGYEAIKNLELNSLDGLFILFPDPLYKTDEEKGKRIDFTWFESCNHALKQGGFIFFATDWMEYYDYLINEINKLDNLFLFETGEYTPEKFGIPKTHYYKKWVRLDREFKYILLTKTT
jgi:tRNA (guanine-N7-)-methyltransferase